MHTVRGRLTLWYAIALTVSVFAFGTALYLERRSSSLDELDQRLVLQAEFAVRWLEESHRVLGDLVDERPAPALSPGIGAYFEGFRDQLIVAGPHGKILFVSEAARQLGYPALEPLASLLRPLPAERRSGSLALAPGRAPVRYLVQPVKRAGSEIGAILVATPTDNVSFGPAALLRSMLLIAPIIIAGAVGLGYWLAGTTLRPVEGIMDEVEAISDGRSLHRRLAVPLSGDEIARLAVTVNGMLARLERSFTSLHRFTADASHELKTPLMVLRAGVERALTHPGTPPEILQSLDETLEQINRMSEMVESLLTLARADEGRAPLAVEDHDLRELTIDIGETAGLLGEEAGLTVTTRLPDHPVLLAVDPHRIREMLLNLVTNAIKYTASGGAVEIVLDDEPDDVSFVVRDTGIGIAPGDLPYIFERFWRADPARSRTGERPGTGLGLAITKWIAEAHGGTITVQSRPGRGSVFTVTLPKHDDRRPTAA